MFGQAMNQAKPQMTEEDAVQEAIRLSLQETDKPEDKK